MGEHTPGPWRFDRDWNRIPSIFGADGRHVADLYKHVKKGEPPTEQMKADAALIEAAPQMLDALLNVRKLISEAAITGFNCHDGDWADRLFASQQKTSNAIASATGSARPLDLNEALRRAAKAEGAR